MKNYDMWQSIQKLIIALEWSRKEISREDALELCPICQNNRKEGHKIGCELANAISTIGSRIYN